MSEESAGAAIAVGEFVIDPVVKVVVRVEPVGSGIVGLAVKRPTAVVIRSPAGTFRFDLDDAEFTDDGWSS